MDSNKKKGDFQPLEKVMEQLHNTLEIMDEIREKILQQQRKVIRLCSELIKDVHRNEKSAEEIDEQITLIKSEFSTLVSLVNETPLEFSHDYRTIAAQEVGEAIIFSNLILRNRFPNLDECSITELEYAYALADVVGELRRYILKLIREEDITRSFELFTYMNEIYQHLFTLDYPNGLIPGLRKKIDTARNLISKTEGDLTLSGTILKLKKELNKV